jgi:hypothetical protein
MAPSKKPKKTIDDAKASQNTIMSDFLKRKALGRCPNAHSLCTDTIGIAGGAKRKRGPVPRDRSKKKKTGKGYAAVTANIELDGSGKRKRGDDVCPSTLKPNAKATRMNWAEGEPPERLTKAVLDWDAGKAFDDGGNKLSLRSFAVTVDIPFGTLSKYAKEDKTKRNRVGAPSGRPALLNTHNQGFIQNVLARQYRANEGSHNE